MKRILLVEDNFDFADNLQELCSFRGMEAVVASSGEAALELVAGGERFDVMLTDLRLPGISGVQLITQLRGLGFSAPVLLMTAYLAEGAEASAEDAGALAVLFKPLDLQRLVKLLDQCTHGDDVVLVLDDNLMHAENLGEALSARGYKVALAGSLNEALSQRLLPRVAIVDFLLPDGTGLDAALRLKSRDPELPILLVSGYPTEAEAWLKQRASGTVFTQRFEKPAALSEVLHAVEAAISQRDGSAANRQKPT